MSPPRPSPIPRSGPATSDGGRRLDSWKEIAQYLGRDVRSLQRWENAEGLPVHRHQHQKRSTVFAWTAELDRWLAARSQPAPEAATLPEPVEPVEAAAPARSEARGPRRWVALLGGLALIAFGLWSPWRSAAGAEVARTRLLVLPLEPIGDGPVDEPLNQGLLEELITRLAALEPRRLTVLGRTSSMHYAGSGHSPAEIGAEVDVAHLLEGSVRRRDRELAVTTRLVRADGEEPLWTRTFTLDLDDLAGAERELADAVAGGVSRAILGSAPAVRTTASVAVSPAAHDACLRGRYLLHKGTEEGFAQSLPHFERALELEPDLVAAHVGVAQAACLLGRYGMRPPDETFPRGRLAAERALALDPDCAEAHAMLALVHFTFDRDFPRAARGFRRAVALAPGIALTHHVYAGFLSAMGLHDEALASIARARELEPLWPLVNSDAAWFLFRARRYEEAIDACRRTLTLEPGYFSPLACLVSCLRRLERPDEAYEVLVGYLEQQGLAAEAGLTRALDPAAGFAAFGAWERAQVEARAQEHYVSPFSHVFTRVEYGYAEEALAWLERGVRTRDRVAVLLRVHPSLDVLRDDPRFQELLEQVGFPADPRTLLDG